MQRDPSAVVLVVAGGDTVDPALAERIGPVGHVIAADSGLHVADELGFTVDVVVGDFDSADPAALARDGLEIERHPRAKDQTDIVLALDRALDVGADSVVVVSGGGGRLDHALANLLVLAAPRYAAMCVRALIGDAEVTVVRDRHTMTGEPGSVVSLFAIDGPAHGVVTDGLRYPLRDEMLEPLSSRGVSNELAAPRATVALDDGVLLVVRPGGERRDSRAEDRSTTDEEVPA
ncbi:MAG TPA: thiamine diphosphokinase [Euzebyales bacterium]